MKKISVKKTPVPDKVLKVQEKSKKIKKTKKKKLSRDEKKILNMQTRDIKSGGYSGKGKKK